MVYHDGVNLDDHAEDDTERDELRDHAARVNATGDRNQLLWSPLEANITHLAEE